MELETAQSGVVEVKDDQIFNFPKGIPGFEDHTSFAVIDLPNSPFTYLQSLKENAVSLLMADPFIFYPDYEFDLPEKVVEELNLGSAFLVRCVLTLNQNIADSTINLLAPIVFNLENRMARQVILHASDYQSRHPLWPDGHTSFAANKEGE
ncbi:flagellar assembly protein FliW [Paenibacillus macerans]|uniref:Flagellar assembly factor FliW n=1 Tax=Paenibacillus macerans TaxID=44252 RepID=A0A6N8EZ96_PAEMA|nr:flagellar assembly protein FliW [Paenibacillus macerans]MUG23692.1 flagellar assembly protein FliW [Paenibacillus macerans]